MVDVMGEQAEKFFVRSGGVDSSRCTLYPGGSLSFECLPGYKFTDEKAQICRKICSQEDGVYDVSML